VVASVLHRPQSQWDTLRRRTRPLRRRPWSVQTQARCVQPRRRIVRQRRPSIRRQSRLATTPVIRWPVLVQWDRQERVDTHPAVLQFSRRRSVWLRLCSSPRHMAVLFPHRCMICLSDLTFLVSLLSLVYRETAGIRAEFIANIFAVICHCGMQPVCDPATREQYRGLESRHQGCIHHFSTKNSTTAAYLPLLVIYSFKFRCAF